MFVRFFWKQNVSKTIALVVGARPNFVKAFSLINASKEFNFDIKLIHTGQHYDENMSKVFLYEFGLEPDVFICKEKLDKKEFLSKCLFGLMLEYDRIKPDIVISVGDTNSSLLAALAANKCRIPVAHVEAGLRSFDNRMEEENNRILIDHISSYLFVTEESGVENLKREGIVSNVFLVGNTMIDTLLSFTSKFAKVEKENFALVTLHRQENVDGNIEKALKYVNKLSEYFPVKFPVHPRTRSKLGNCRKNIELLDPLCYTDFIQLLMKSKLVLTDSGGVQEESSILNVPCFTLRQSTERPVTTSHGTNKLVTSLEEFEKAISKLEEKLCIIPLWDGLASKRILAILEGGLT